MLARLHSAAVRGIHPLRVTIEVDVSGGLPSWTTVGLPDRAVSEGRMRVRAAIETSGLEVRTGRVVVSLAPADLHKDGAAYDLPIALGLLQAAGALDVSRLRNMAILGELALDGSLNPVRGVLPIATAAARMRLGGMLVPRANAREAAAAGIAVRSAASLADIIAFCRGGRELPLGAPAGGDDEGGAPDEGGTSRRIVPVPDLADVQGQTDARRALEIAAAGGHSVLLSGPPGCGKSMLARRLPGILPPLTHAEALETTSIHSVAGQLAAGAGLLAARPFRSPHHTASAVSLVGGGTRLTPGEISLAHNGVLFLDELPEFPRHVLETLRQPLEEGRVVVSRAVGSAALPARCMLVAAMNLCPCGALGSGQPCTCSPAARATYRARISGPLLDRIDLIVPMQALTPAELMAPLEGPAGKPLGEESATVRERVVAARARQAARGGARGPRCNAEMASSEVRRWCTTDRAGRAVLAEALRRTALSARGCQRVLRVARTIADLRGGERLRADDLLEAVSLRRLEGFATEESGGALAAVAV